jgi:hypothetical protein
MHVTNSCSDDRLDQSLYYFPLNYLCMIANRYLEKSWDPIKKSLRLVVFKRVAHAMLILVRQSRIAFLTAFVRGRSQSRSKGAFYSMTNQTSDVGGV